MNTLALTRHAFGSALVLAGLMLAPAYAADADRQALIVAAQADGEAIAVQRTDRGLEVRAMRHRADAVASECLTLETRSGPGARSTPVLRNLCEHAVTVSYCIDSDSGRSGNCAAVGTRGLDATRLEAGVSLVLEGDTRPDADVNWIACRGDVDAVSSLIAEGRRGECLASVSETEMADARP